MTTRASFRRRRFRLQATMAFTLKVNGTAHSVVVNPDTIAAVTGNRIRTLPVDTSQLQS
jgi:hypothetical protein